LGNPVDNPSNSRADGAYDRALAAYQEKSYAVARRWAVEALAHDRQHSGARALLARLDASRPAVNPFQSSSGSEVVTVDPTVLISRASQPAAAVPVDPTVMARNDAPRRRPADTDARPAVPPLTRATARPVAEPTVIAPPKPRASSSRPTSSFSLGAALQSLGERLQGRGSRPGSQAATGRVGSTAGSWTSTPGARGALIAVATVAVGALLVWVLFRTVRWFFPPGELLTITKPEGGTIVGPGLECGTGGSRCSTTRPTDEMVELEARADKDYVFSDFTGDCAPRGGRISMSQPRSCGAKFGHVVAPPPTVTFRLTITKPEGGTIVGDGGILCGVLGSICSADIPSGAPVTLTANAAEGYVSGALNGDCPAAGDMTMTSAKTCGAVFIKTDRPDVNPDPERSRPRPGGGGKGPSSAPSGPGPKATGVVLPPPPPVVPMPPPPTEPKDVQVPLEPAKGPISRDDHAKQEIQALLKRYCEALQTLKPAAVQSLYNQNNEPDHLKEQLKEYKSLKCTLAPEPPEYTSLDSSEAGGVAKLKFGMKRVIVMRSGGAPKDYETIVTTVVSRKNFQSPWLIDRATHEEKPK
jgi:hypothetical protein